MSAVREWAASQNSKLLEVCFPICTHFVQLSLLFPNLLELLAGNTLREQ